MNYTFFVSHNPKRVITLDIVDYMNHRVDPSKISIPMFFSCLHHLVSSVRSELADAQTKYDPVYEEYQDDILISIPNIDKQLDEIYHQCRKNINILLRDQDSVNEQLAKAIIDELDNCAHDCVFNFLASVGSNVRISITERAKYGPFGDAAESLKNAHIHTQAEVVYLGDDNTFDCSNTQTLYRPMSKDGDGTVYIGSEDMPSFANSYTYTYDSRSRTKYQIPLSKNDYVIGTVWLDFSSKDSKLMMPGSLSDIHGSAGDAQPILSESILSNMRDIINCICVSYTEEAANDDYAVRTPCASTHRVLSIIYTGFDDVADDWIEHYKDDMKRLGYTTIMSRASYKQMLKEVLDKAFQSMIAELDYGDSLKIVTLDIDQYVD